MQIYVGTNNPLKVSATKHVFKEFFPKDLIMVNGEKVASNVSNQPFSQAETIKGAKNRAKALYDKNKSTGDYFVGIEAGLVQIDSAFLDFQFCEIINQQGQEALGVGPGWQYPPAIVKQLKENSRIEMGEIMAEITGDQNTKYKDGAIGYFSTNLLNREEITKIAVRMALIPFLNPKTYF